MLLSELASLRTIWLTGDQSQGGNGLQRASLAICIILFTDFNIDQDGQLPHRLSQILKLAVQIDMQSISELDPTSKQIILSLHGSLEEKHVNEIVTLEQAIAQLADPQFNLVSDEQKTIARKILKAAELMYRTIPVPRYGHNMVSVTENDETRSFVFHGEHHPNQRTRTDTLKRLYDSLISCWNHAVKTNHLPFFLNRLYNGLCIEGCTRQAMEDLHIATGEIQERLSTDFNATMEIAYTSATDLLSTLKLPTSHDSVKDLILCAYNYKTCAPREGLPERITGKHVDTYINQLMIHDGETRFHADEDADALAPKDYLELLKTRLVGCTIAGGARIIQTIFKVAPPAHGVALFELRCKYTNLCQVPTNPASVRLYLGHLDEIPPGTCINTQGSALTFAISNGAKLLVQALLEYKQHDILSSENVAMSPFQQVAEKFKDDCINELLENIPNILLRLTTEILFDNNRMFNGEHVPSLAISLSKSESGIRALGSILQARQDIRLSITTSMLLSGIDRGGLHTLVRHLLNHASGIALLRDIYALAAVNRNPLFLFNYLTSESENRMVLNMNASQPLWILLSTGGETGAQFLLDMINKDNALRGNPNDENEYLQGNLIPLQTMMSPALLYAPSLAAGALCQLLQTTAGREVLRVLNKGADIARTMDLRVFYNTILSLAKYQESVDILSFLFEHQKNLFESVPAERLIRAPLAGQESVITHLVKTQQGYQILHYLLLNNQDLRKTIRYRDIQGIMAQIKQYQNDEGNTFLYDFLHCLLVSIFTQVTERRDPDATDLLLLMSETEIDSVWNILLTPMTIQGTYSNCTPLEVMGSMPTNLRIQDLLRYLANHPPTQPGQHFNAENFYHRKYKNKSLFWSMLNACSYVNVANIRGFILGILGESETLRNELKWAILSPRTENSYYDLTPLELAMDINNSGILFELVELCPNLLEGATPKELKQIIQKKGLVNKLAERPNALLKFLKLSPQLTIAFNDASTKRLVKQLCKRRLTSRRTKIPSMLSSYLKSKDGQELFAYLMENVNGFTRTLPLNTFIFDSLGYADTDQSPFLDELCTSRQGINVLNLLLTQSPNLKEELNDREYSTRAKRVILFLCAQSKEGRELLLQHGLINGVDLGDISDNLKALDQARGFSNDNLTIFTKQESISWLESQSKGMKRKKDEKDDNTEADVKHFAKAPRSAQALDDPTVAATTTTSTAATTTTAATDATDATTTTTAGATTTTTALSGLQFNSMMFFQPAPVGGDAGGGGGGGPELGYNNEGQNDDFWVDILLGGHGFDFNPKP